VPAFCGPWKKQDFSVYAILLTISGIMTKLPVNFTAFLSVQAKDAWFSSSVGEPRNPAQPEVIFFRSYPFTFAIGEHAGRPQPACADGKSGGVFFGLLINLSH